ncbi:MAG: AI-2E family transporter [Bacteroidetes bacterium]|nr:AI-2E family transporter [Bacteroidota bacterium]
MKTSEANDIDEKRVKTAVDITLKVGILLLILAWCFQIISPFISIVFWSMIIAISIFPAFNILSKKLNGKKKISAVVVTASLLAFILIPGILFTDSMVAGIKKYSKELNTDDFKIPTPDARVKDWPLIGETVYNGWDQAYKDPENSVKTYAPQLKSAGKWFLDALMGTGIGFLQFVISIVISGIFLATAESSGRFLNKLFNRLVGVRGDEFAETAKNTIRNVSKGVIGVAFIQSILAGFVFVLAGVPYAGLWALVCLILAIIQIGPGLVIIPVIIYLFTVMDTWAAILWTIVLIVVMLSDNVLKPLLMGKGSTVPTLVVFLGSIGGFITSGFMGLFLGAIVLSLGYKLLISWVNEGGTIKQSANAIDKA